MYLHRNPIESHVITYKSYRVQSPTLSLLTYGSNNIYFVLLDRLWRILILEVSGNKQKYTKPWTWDMNTMFTSFWKIKMTKTFISSVWFRIWSQTCEQMMSWPPKEGCSVKTLLKTYENLCKSLSPMLSCVFFSTKTSFLILDSITFCQKLESNRGTY